MSEPVAWIIEQTDPHEDKIFEGSRRLVWPRRLVWHPYAPWYDTETWGDGRAMWRKTPLYAEAASPPTPAVTEGAGE